jgi:hypothetical protein
LLADEREPARDEFSAELLERAPSFRCVIA